MTTHLHPDDDITCEHAADVIGVLPETVMEWVRQGRITAVQEEPLTFRKDEIDSFVAHRRAEQREAFAELRAMDLEYGITD